MSAAAAPASELARIDIVRLPRVAFGLRHGDAAVFAVDGASFGTARPQAAARTTGSDAAGGFECGHHRSASGERIEILAVPAGCPLSAIASFSAFEASPAWMNTRRGSICSAFNSQERIGCGTEMPVSTSPRPPRCSLSRSGRPANIATAIMAICATSTGRSRRTPPADEPTPPASLSSTARRESQLLDRGTEHVVRNAHAAVGDHDPLGRERAVRKLAALPMQLGNAVEHFLQHEHARPTRDRLSARLCARQHLRESRASRQIVNQADRRQPSGYRTMLRMVRNAG